jgi:predicted nuclease of restriction endonuclease-like (RecB) superfamily
MNKISNKIAILIEQARRVVAKNANLAMVATYYQIGKILIEEWQQGEKRAEYGVGLLENVSADLKATFGKGFSVQNLERMRNFYVLYSGASTELRDADIFQNSSKPLRKLETDEKSSNILRKFDNELNINFLPISWSHYLFLMRIKDETERQFYEIESFQNAWTLKELERQFNTGLYERLAVGKNKEEIMRLAQHGQIVEKLVDLLKDPLILDFLGLEGSSKYSETELETAIINQIEKFMLEMGKGFFFGGRQVRFSFNEEHYFVDLVFYNRFLKCFVLLDLKIGKLKHQDIGQMQMYVNYYDRFVKQPDENDTIGIVLCKTKEDAIVEITLPKNNTQIFASQYETVLPSKVQLLNILNSKEYDNKQ